MPAAVQLPFFVYGTLLSGQPNDHLWRASVTARQEGRFLNALLFDFGAFPMLVEGLEGCVVGQVVTIAPEHYQDILARLDELEEFDPGAAQMGPFRRARRFVLVNNGQSVECWVYLGHSHFVAGRAPIPGGNWQQHTELLRARLDEQWRDRRLRDSKLIE